MARSSSTSKHHPGFAAVQNSLAKRIEEKNPKLSPKDAQRQAAAELAAATRRASSAAKKANPRLKRVSPTSKELHPGPGPHDAQRD